MAVTGDRPAAELLAKWEALESWQDKIAFQARYDYTALLARLARVEQALADVEALHMLGDFEMCTCCGEFPFPCRTVAALRTTQGGQT